MNKIIKDVNKYLSANNERVSLQRLYLIFFVIIFVIGTIINYFNHDLAYKVLYLSFIALIIYITNAIIWTLGSALKNNFLSKKSSTSSKKK
ncbi:Uncharacterised protein [Chlamydia trachomatis]|nr:Uncharacterised protein [Chlamydia trachomatis]